MLCHNSKLLFAWSGMLNHSKYIAVNVIVIFLYQVDLQKVNQFCLLSQEHLQHSFLYPKIVSYIPKYFHIFQNSIVYPKRHSWKCFELFGGNIYPWYKLAQNTNVECWTDQLLHPYINIAKGSVFPLGLIVFILPYFVSTSCGTFLFIRTWILETFNQLTDQYKLCFQTCSLI